MLRSAFYILLLAAAPPVTAQVAAPAGPSFPSTYGAGWYWAPGTQGPVMAHPAYLTGVQARPGQVREGYAVYSTEGPLIGRIAYADSHVAVVKSAQWALRLPVAAFGIRTNGLLLKLSPANFDSLAKRHGARAG